jgi:putative redox protein
MCLQRLFREAARAGITLRRVGVTGNSDYVGDPAVSTPIEYGVELEGEAPEDVMSKLVERIDQVAEIPNSIRPWYGGTPYVSPNLWVPHLGPPAVLWR